MSIHAYPLSNYDPGIPLCPLISFIGREALIGTVKELLLVPPRAHLMLSLYGIVGIGKTAMGIRLAYDQEIRTVYPDGVLWASLGPKPHLKSIWQRWGSVLGLSEKVLHICETSEQWRITLHQAISGRRILVILDDVRRHSDMMALNVGGRFCATIVTTRSPRLAAQWGNGKHSWRLSCLPEKESLHLLLAGIPLPLEQEQDVILFSQQGLPLSLVIARSVLRRATSLGLKRHIQHALHQISDPSTLLHLTVHQDPVGFFPSLPYRSPFSLHLVFAEAEQQVPEQIRLILRQDGFPVSLCHREGVGVDMPPPFLFPSLEGLCETGLVEKSSNASISIHPLVRDYFRQDEPNHPSLGDNSASSTRSEAALQRCSN